MTQWPRGLVDYAPTTPEESPSEEEDRTRQRLHLAARLIGLLRASGESADDELCALVEAERAYRGGDAERARELVDAVLGRLDTRTARRSSRPTP